MEKLKVSKYHGLGNDFVMARFSDAKKAAEALRLHADTNAESLGFDKNEAEAGVFTGASVLARAVCDRHAGIGADGMILVRDEPLEMIYFNQDGSRAPMCGNGIRCFAAFCYDEGICTEETYPAETLAGVQQITRLSADPFLVRIGMGTPDFSGERLSLSERAPSPLWNVPVTLSSGKTVKLYSFFMGTIHTVVFTEDAFAPENEVIGRELCMHPYFKEQTNVNFVQVLDKNRLCMQTYERGCGMTLACGTGACAAAVCAAKLGYCDLSVDVQLRLGQLRIEIDEQSGAVRMTGPAKRIMTGSFIF